MCWHPFEIEQLWILPPPGIWNFLTALLILLQNCRCKELSPFSNIYERVLWTGILNKLFLQGGERMKARERENQKGKEWEKCIKWKKCNWTHSWPAFKETNKFYGYCGSWLQLQTHYIPWFFTLFLQALGIKNGSCTRKNYMSDIFSSKKPHKIGCCSRSSHYNSTTTAHINMAEDEKNLEEF